jgi:hypothetical protein
MEKTALGLFAALGAAAVAPAAANASAPSSEAILNPSSVAELLEPVANPVATLNDLQQRQLEAVETPDAEVAQLVVVRHHHHHHHVVIIRRHHHHHHFAHHHHHHHD